ncbi:uncharacterized protein C3orf86 homolog [Grammomys surdaster]|uniref:uncharacterized protein C3orf86 homolog n=1 Tax=Grammomys surdaster TaxID=491861 RepID=UPI0010A051BD|nr:uncharacterized protein C3orf86 homolog [Grammomys surdaster]
MSRSQLEQEKKSLDSFVWVNEITGEITFPLGEETTPAASGEKSRARSGSPRGSVPCAAAVHRPGSPGNPEAPGRGLGMGSLILPDLAVPRVLSPPGSALPRQHYLAASPPLATMLPASPSAPWALSCKLRNMLTGNNRFSF